MSADSALGGRAVAPGVPRGSKLAAAVAVAVLAWIALFIAAYSLEHKSSATGPTPSLAAGAPVPRGTDVVRSRQTSSPAKPAPGPAVVSGAVTVPPLPRLKSPPRAAVHASTAVAAAPRVSVSTPRTTSFGVTGGGRTSTGTGAAGGGSTTHSSGAGSTGSSSHTGSSGSGKGTSGGGSGTGTTSGGG